MSFSIFSSLSWMAATAAALGPIANTYTRIPNGYSLVNVTWSGNLTANGPEVSFTGASFQDVEAQIRRANPNFAWPDGDATDVSLPPSSSSDKAVARLSCDVPEFWYATKYRVDEGIQYLRGKTGRCHIDAGPGVCSRISCSYDSAIFFCNDNDAPLDVDCSEWSEYAQDIVDACTDDDTARHVRGQQFNKRNWNVIVGYSKC
ncbi:hypothetical protein Hte_011176 [Hypoxylon texense]